MHLRNACLQLANCALFAFCSLVLGQAVFAQETIETKSQSHQLTAKCVSPAGILLCTECRASAGLAPILAEGNAGWRPSQENGVVQLVSFTPVTLTASSEDDCCKDGKCEDCKKGHDEDEDDGDDEEECPCKKCEARKAKHAHDAKVQHKSPRRTKHDESQFYDRPDSPRGRGPMPIPRMPHPPMPRQAMQRPQPPRPALHAPVRNPMEMQRMVPEAGHAHLETLEVLRNINRSLQSIEAMMRQEKEHRDHNPQNHPPMGHSPMGHSPDQPHFPGAGPGAGHQNFQMRGVPGADNQFPNFPGHPAPMMQPGHPGQNGPMVPPNNGGPHRNDGPRNDGPRNDGPRNDGPRNDGPRNDGPRNDGPRN